MNRASLFAGSLSVLLVVSALATGGAATGSQAATELTECTTIAEPGTYELTEDIEYSDDDCIQVEADDVTIDGNGYSINNTESGDTSIPQGHGLTVFEQRNVTVRDVTFTEYARVYVDDSTAVTIENNDVNSLLKVRSSQGLTIRDNHFATQEVDIRYSEDIRLVNNHIEGVDVSTNYETANVTARDNYGDGRLAVSVGAGEGVIENNSLWHISVSGGEGTRVVVTRNHAGSVGLSVRSNGVARVHNNTVDGGTLSLAGTSDDYIATHNTVTNSDVGVHISGGYDAGPDVLFKHNRITNNDIGIETYSNLPDIDQNDLSGNSEYGITYEQDFGVVNAANNYWGDRPSSPDDEDAPFEDPETGTLADGSGSAVSEASRSAGSDPGVSNIHFDPWLDSAPDAGVVGEESDNDDSGEETTTTTTTTTTEATTTTTVTATTTPTTIATTTPTTDATTTNTVDETTTGDGETTATTDESATPTTMSEDTTTPSDDATTTAPESTTPETTATPATNQTRMITGTTASEAPGFSLLLAVIALLGSTLLVARPI